MQSRASRQTAPEGSPYSRHLPPLDGIRGLAVLAVVVSHIFPGASHSPGEAAVHTILEFGANGVDLFFVLSGFLITGILYDSLSDPAFFRKFYARRILRIFPLYYGVLAAFALAGLILGLNYHHELLSHALYLQNSVLIAPLIANHTEPGTLPLAHFWSLAVEEQFYLFWPITIFLLRKRRRMLFFCAASLLLCPVLRFILLQHGVGFFAIHVNTLCRSDSLLAGSALSLLLRSRFHDKTLRAAGWIFAGGLLGGAALCYLLPLGFATFPSAFPNLLDAFWYSAVATISVGLIALALRSRMVGSIFSIELLRWLGKYSYGIYVLHLILFAYLQEPVRGAIEHYLTPNKGAGVVLTGLLIFAISILAAYLSYNLYERRFLRLKRYFDYRHHPDTVNDVSWPARVKDV